LVHKHSPWKIDKISILLRFALIFYTIYSTAGTSSKTMTPATAAEAATAVMPATAEMLATLIAGTHYQ
jgi:hypothetical protein